MKYHSNNRVSNQNSLNFKISGPNKEQWASYQTRRRKLQTKGISYTLRRNGTPFDLSSKLRAGSRLWLLQK